MISIILYPGQVDASCKIFTRYSNIFSEYIRRFENNTDIRNLEDDECFQSRIYYESCFNEYFPCECEYIRVKYSK